MSKPSHFVFRLYVAGDSPNAMQAIANLTALCQAHLAGRHEIEVIDVFRRPDRALADGVMMTPLLIRLSPAPIRRLIGNLTRHEAVRQILEPQSSAS